MSAARGPNPLLRLDHRALSALHTGPTDLGEEWASKSILTLCFWFYAPDPTPIQVLANDGHRRWTEPGWSIYLQDGCIVASVRTDRDAVAIAAPLSARDAWHHFIVTLDRQDGSIDAWLNGRHDAWQPTVMQLTPAGEAAHQRGLTVGGYTDAAGGHFNYTFGRRAGDRLDDLRLYDRRLAADEIGAFINPVNRPPVAKFFIQAERNTAPATAKLDASAAFDPDGVLIAYWWDFGDGSRGEGVTVEHEYAHAGRYPVRLTVLDDDHGQAVAEQILELGGAPAPVRFTPVFVNGEEGYAAFRIPAIVAGANGNLLAFAEGRVESVSDSTRTIRIVCKRSTDGGESWGPLQVVGRACFDGEEYAAMYPAPVVDTLLGTGRIVLLFKQMRASEWELVQGKGSSRMACVISDDHGVSWSAARDITAQVHQPDAWRIQIPTAGHAIQLRGTAQNPDLRGRLFFIGSHTNGADSVFDQWNYAFWSDDLGESWQMGPEIACRANGTSAQGLNEATAVELSDGRVLINSRNYQDGRPVGCRALTVGRFDKEGWLHFDAARHAPALVEPPVQASMVRAAWPDPGVSGDRGCVLFANPAHDAARLNLTVRASFDDGATWPVAKTIDPGPSAYSDLVVQADGQIGVLYERGNDGGIWYGAFQLDWLTHL